MSDQHMAAKHHASAAFHHQQSAQLHREASRHFEAGKDYNHAAHKALVAHGHALHAIGRGNDAAQYYAGHDSTALPGDQGSVVRFPPKSVDASGATQAALSGAGHHAAAADHHEQAEQHHTKASRHLQEKNEEEAAHEAQIAHRHAHLAVFHSDEAAMHHVEHYGASGPTAEIV